MKFSALFRCAVAFACAALGALACSSSSTDSDPGGDAAMTQATLDAYCNAYCDFSRSCFSQPDPACVTSCTSRYQARAPRMRDSYLKNTAKCTREHVCDARSCCDSWKRDCEAKYVFSDPAFPNVTIVQKCRNVASAAQSTDGNCGDKPNGAGYRCDALATLTNGYRQNAESACLGGNKTCDALIDCLDQALAW